MQGFEFQIGITLSVFLYGKLAKRDLGSRRRKRPPADVIAFLAPETPSDAVSLEIIERQELMERPDGGRGRRETPQAGRGLGLRLNLPRYRAVRTSMRRSRASW